MEIRKCCCASKSWYEPMGLVPVAVSTRDLLKSRVLLDDCGIGLRVDDFDAELERMDWDGYGVTYFRVGMVSVSWGVLARVSVSCLSSILFAHISADRKPMSIKAGNGWMDVRLSFYPHHNGEIRVFTSLDCRETMVRYGRHVELRGMDNCIN